MRANAFGWPSWYDSFKFEGIHTYSQTSFFQIKASKARSRCNKSTVDIVFHSENWSTKLTLNCNISSNFPPFTTEHILTNPRACIFRIGCSLLNVHIDGHANFYLIQQWWQTSNDRTLTSKKHHTTNLASTQTNAITNTKKMLNCRILYK